MKIPKLLQATLTIVVIYAAFILVFDLALGQVIPRSLLNMYMFFIVAGVFMVFTFTEQGGRELTAPIKALVEDPSRRGLRNVLFAVAPILAAGITYFQMQPSFEAPVELRSIHPAPPNSIKIGDKRYDLLKIVNPLRKYEKQDPERFKQLVTQGGGIYAANCHYCHGDKLDGAGPYAQGLNPVPLNFQDVGTIAQLQESYLFWRIASGGPGLPKEGSPWLSAMPVWQDILSEEEIWQVILYLYDYTGHRPRTWEHE